MATRLFQTAMIGQSKSIQRVGRQSLMTIKTAEELNTYKNFGVFASVAETWTETYNKDGGGTGTDTKPNMDKDSMGTPAVRSLFNKHLGILTGANSKEFVDKNGVYNLKNWENLVLTPSDWRKGLNMPLLDTPMNRKISRETSGCTVKELVEASENGYFGRAGTYSYSDFMYCKYLDRVPNTYLITLRRFPIPILDGITPQGYGGTRKSKETKSNSSGPIGQMVTWLGVSGNEMKSLLKYSYKMSFKEQEAQYEQLDKIGGGDQGWLNFMEGMTNPATRTAYKQGQANPAMDNGMGAIGKLFGIEAGGGPYDPNTTLQRHRTKVYGPIDRVKKLYTRDDKGLDFDMNLTITFEYELKAYNGINPKQALLDLLGNILSVTYTTGSFWGGDYKPVAITQSSAYQNLNIFKCHGTFTDFVDAAAKDIKSGIKKFGKANNFGTDLKSIWKGALNVLNEIGGMLMGGLLNSLGRPAKYFAQALLTDMPSGLWHVTIGNPHHPIMTIGNLVLTNTTIEHSGPLGLDDFPTNLKVTCELKRGRPRDQILIENMYMQGNDRITYSQDTKTLQMYRTSEMWKKNREKIITKLEDGRFRKDPDATDQIDQEKLEELMADANAWGEEYDAFIQAKNAEATAAAAKDKSKETSPDGSTKTTADNVDDVKNNEEPITMADVEVKGDYLQKYFGDFDPMSVMYAAGEAGLYGAFPKSKPDPEEKPPQNDNPENKPEGQ